MKLNKLELIVSKTMHYQAKDSLEIIKKLTGITRKDGWLSAKRKEIEGVSLQILFEDAKRFPSLHLERVNILRDMSVRSMNNVMGEDDPLKNQHIIDSIVKMQYDLASFDEATKSMIEGNNEGIKTSIPIPEE